MKLFLTIIFIFLATIIIHIPTFAGLDTDFQTYSFASKMIFNGFIPYVDFFADNKPPLYYLLLLPGNFIGGKLISFFVVHLVIVGVIGVLIYYVGAKMTERNEPQIGWCSWGLFQLLTAIQFMDYGNLNGSIVYAVILFELISIFIFVRIINHIKTSWNFHNILFLGILAGLAFFTRMSVTIIFLYILLQLFKMLSESNTIINSLKSLSFFCIGFIIPILIGIDSLSLKFDELIKYTMSYNYSYAGNFGLKRILSDFIETSIGLAMHTRPLIIYALLFSLYVLYRGGGNFYFGSRLFSKKYLICLLITLLSSQVISFFIQYDYYLFLAILLLIVAAPLMFFINEPKYQLALIIILTMSLLFSLSWTWRSQNPTFFDLYSYRAGVGIFFIFGLLIEAVITYKIKNNKKQLNKYFVPRIVSSETIPHVIYFLVAYFSVEFLQIILFGTGAKQYPFFMTFVPLCLISGFFVVRLSKYLHIPTNQSKIIKIVNQHNDLYPGIILVLICLMVGFYSLNQGDVKNRILSVNPYEQLYTLIDKTHERSWPEQKLINYIENNSENEKDFYAFHFGAYLYLETDKIPPISIFSYVPAWWNGWGSDHESENILTENFLNSNPRFITCAQGLNIPDQFLAYLSNNYIKRDSYYTNYSRGYVDLYERL
jgi:hypothetical protein